MYDVKSIHFIDNRKFKRYFIDLYELDMKFDNDQLTGTRVYFNSKDNALHFTESRNDRKYNRVYLDSVIKVVYFRLGDQNIREEQKENGQNGKQFMSIKYKNQEKGKSVILIEIENEEIMRLLSELLEQTIQIYDKQKFIESK